MGMKRKMLIADSSCDGIPPGTSDVAPPPAFPVVRLRGLPFGCTEDDIDDFFHGLDVIDILFLHQRGRFASECYCVLGYPRQVDLALLRNNQNIGNRYVEVLRSKRQEYYKAIAIEVSNGHSGSPRRLERSVDDGAKHTGVLRLRGLPFSAVKEDILDFFKDFPLSYDKIHIRTDSTGRPSGEAFVEFANAKDSGAAMSKDRMTLGSRYIEIFPSSPKELKEAVARGREVAEPTTVIRMRGLPFEASKKEIMDFFKDFKLSEDSVHMTFTSDGLPSGEAYVVFTSSDDAKTALVGMNRMTLGSRYMELFASTLEELNNVIAKER